MKFIHRILLAVALLGAGPLHAERIKDITSLQGVRSNQLVGYGLVVGLDGSGDQTTQTPFTVQSMVSMLNQLGVTLPPGTSLQLKNVAAVSVTASVPAFARAGQAIDVTVSSIGNAKSLRGGTLLMTPLKGADGNVYAVAQGNILLAGAGASAGGSSAQINQLNAGRIPAGATIEREVSTPLGQGEFVNLELGESDFTTANRVVEAINQAFGDYTAQALDGRMIRVVAPQDSQQRVAFLAKMENLTVNRGEDSPKVIVNARTGSIVMNQLVAIANCAVAHGNLAVTISTEPVISQPGAFSAGQSVVEQKAQIEISSDKGGLVVIPSSPSLGEVVKALNAVGATPQDLLAILQALKAAGALRAELEII
ncbi:MAG: flagellar basal body P-ring protein FlgI [Pseudomonadota bacterium]